MNELIALLSTTVGPPMAQLLALGLVSLTDKIKAMNAPVTMPGIVREIIDGVNNSEAFRGFSGDQKRIEARRGIGQLIINHGGTPDAATINTLIELAYIQDAGKAGIA